MSTSGYTPAYYERLKASASSSARVVVPLVLDLLRPASVVDVGCGSAEWAAVFKSHGVSKILGIDGEYVDREELAISADEFMAADLTQVLEIPRQFDLAISLEVAEHLPMTYARHFVTSLTRLAPVVLFSAAIPNQGGEQHVNEQWPQYWADLFEQHQYAAFDILRSTIWSNPAVQWWYAQNLLLFVSKSHVGDFPNLERLQPTSSIPPLVHPRCLEQLAWKCRVRDSLVELIDATVPDSNIVLIDDSQMGELPEIGRRIRPINFEDGIDFGPPEDSQTALSRLQRQINSDADYVAFAWPSFWWLDHYVEFASQVRCQGCKILSSPDWIVFAVSKTAIEYWDQRQL